MILSSISYLNNSYVVVTLTLFQHYVPLAENNRWKSTSPWLFSPKLRQTFPYQWETLLKHLFWSYLSLQSEKGGIQSRKKTNLSIIIKKDPFLFPSCLLYQCHVMWQEISQAVIEYFMQKNGTVSHLIHIYIQPKPQHPEKVTTGLKLLFGKGNKEDESNASTNNCL